MNNYCLPNKTKNVDYYVKKTNINGSILIAKVDKETIDCSNPEALGKIIYCSANPRLVNTFWREKKATMKLSNYQFSKKGFVIPPVENIPYQPLVKIPPL